MMKRIRQFYQALRATITEKDKQFVEQKLPLKAQRLFWRMSVADQYHALHVAYTALDILQSVEETCNVDLMCRIALLHDIGRVHGSMNTGEKSMAVLIASFFPEYAKSLSQCETGWISKVMYMYFYHPEIGADMLKKINMEQEADIIRCHHKSFQVSDRIELQLLRIADSLN